MSHLIKFEPTQKKDTLMTPHIRKGAVGVTQQVEKQTL
jgi:hypothetical protein